MKGETAREKNQKKQNPNQLGMSTSPLATASQQTAEHIDEKQLNELGYRFEYLCKFMNFGEDEIKTIKGAADAVAPLVPTIVDAVYTKLFSFDITKKYFLVRNENFTGEVAPSADKLTQENEQTKFRKEMLSKYLAKLVTADYDINLLKYLDRVGKIHTSKAGNKNIVVDYIHINGNFYCNSNFWALMGYVEDIILNAIMGLNVPLEAKTKLIRAFNKLLWIQNDLFTRHYITEEEPKAETK